MEETGRRGELDRGGELALALYDALAADRSGGHVQGDPRVSAQSIVDGYFDLRAVSERFLEAVEGITPR